MRTVCLGFVCLVALVSMTASARAGNEDEAKNAFQEGKRAFERGEYESALAQFHRADMLLPSPKLSYNIGACYERLGKYQDAVLAFERYLQLVGPPQDDTERKFQQDLRVRITADRGRVESRPPTSVAPPPSPSASNNPQVTPPPPMPLAKEQRIVDAKRRRSAGIALSAIGGSVLAVGLTLLIHGAVAPYDAGCDFDGCYNYGVGSITEITFGVLGTILGTAMGIPGVAQLVSAQRTLHELSFAPEPRTPFSPARANVFSIPVLRF